MFGAASIQPAADGATPSIAARDDMNRVEAAKRNGFARSLAAGAVSGFLATGPMSGAMLAMQRLLPWRERYSLPPRRIVSRITTMLGVRHKTDRQQIDLLTALAHFGYGAGAGTVYAPLARLARIPGALSGVVYGLLVWTASYLGLLPALGILSPATEHPARRNALMIVAHAVWGACLGALVARMSPRQQ
jgi:uncharacterized membrane protein YagU involved in acid resistance